MILLSLIFFWLASPQTNQWQSVENWSPNGLPFQNDLAVFNSSFKRDIDLTMAPSIGEVQFNGLSSFKFQVKPLAFFLLNGQVRGMRPPEIIVNGAFSGSPGQMEVSALGNLGKARVILKGVTNGNGAKLEIFGHAGNARIYVNSESYLLFEGNGNADESQILAKPGIHGMFGGQIYFYGESNAENATITLAGTDSAIQAQEHNGTLTIGRLDGTGVVFLGGNQLIIKSGNFSGTIVP